MNEEKLIKYINLIKENQLKVLKMNLNKSNRKYIDNMNDIKEKTIKTYKTNIIMIISEVMKDKYNFDYTYRMLNNLSKELFNIVLDKKMMLKEVKEQKRITKNNSELNNKMYQENIIKFRKEYKKFIKQSLKLNEELKNEIFGDKNENENE